MKRETERERNIYEKKERERYIDVISISSGQSSIETYLVDT